jgi:hypothetical protein
MRFFRQFSQWNSNRNLPHRFVSSFSFGKKNCILQERWRWLPNWGTAVKNVIIARFGIPRSLSVVHQQKGSMGLSTMTVCWVIRLNAKKPLEVHHGLQMKNGLFIPRNPFKTRKLKVIIQFEKTGKKWKKLIINIQGWRSWRSCWSFFTIVESWNSRYCLSSQYSRMECWTSILGSSSYFYRLW